jgi:RimJ/RimL family protein N-acetyltransferase
MTPVLNPFGQPVGPALPHWQAPPHPRREPMEGTYCRLEPLDLDQHSAALHHAMAQEPDDAAWTYLPYGPFPTLPDYQAWVAKQAASTDPLFFAIIDRATGLPGGVAAYLRIEPAHGNIEVGHLYFTPELRGTRTATEAMYLMTKQAFTLGYRRYEWKCDVLNVPSRRAAARLGFTFEGLFRQAVVVKGRNRDTAWHSIIDTEWPTLQQAFATWLAPDNFEPDGTQRQRLSDLTRDALLAM